MQLDNGTVFMAAINLARVRETQWTQACFVKWCIDGQAFARPCGRHPESWLAVGSFYGASVQLYPKWWWWAAFMRGGGGGHLAGRPLAQLITGGL